MNKHRIITLGLIIIAGLSLGACANHKKQGNPSYHTKLSEHEQVHHNVKRTLTRHSARQLIKIYQKEQNILTEITKINTVTAKRLKAHPRVSYIKVKRAFERSYQTNPKVKAKIIPPTYFSRGSYMYNLLTQEHYYDAVINQQENRPVSRWAKTEIPKINKEHAENSSAEKKAKHSTMNLQKTSLRIYKNHGRI